MKVLSDDQVEASSGGASVPRVENINVH